MHTDQQRTMRVAKIARSSLPVIPGRQTFITGSLLRREMTMFLLCIVSARGQEVSPASATITAIHNGVRQRRDVAALLSIPDMLLAETYLATFRQ